MVGYLYLFILNSAFPTEDTTSERGGGVYQLLPWDAKNTFPSGETRDTKQKENSEDEIVRKLLACYSFKWVYVEWIKLVVFGFLRVYKFLFFFGSNTPTIKRSKYLQNKNRSQQLCKK